MTKTDLLLAAQVRYREYQAQGLKLDMTRGKPAPEQLDLANGMMTILGESIFRSADGGDCRNYGTLEGLAEARKLFADYLEVTPKETLVGGNASLNMMYDALTRAMLFGVPGSSKPWSRLEKVKWLCPSPGYDRHFNICQDLGIEMITVPMNDDGPDMNIVSKLAAEDHSIKGIWCVPRYSNPTGITYSPEVVEALAKMEAADDFRIFWDNAYHVHHLVENPKPLANIMDACKRANHPDRVYIFGSTSKISYAGAGVAMFAASERNIAETIRHLSNQTIGFDKVNQLRHVLFFENMTGIERHMRKHAAILKPKFDTVDEVLRSQLGRGDFANWSTPEGGYFISLDTRPGLAGKVVAMAEQAGVKLTAAGSTYPGRKDPADCNIRIAPSLPNLTEIRKAMEIVATCVVIATLEA